MGQAGDTLLAALPITGASAIKKLLFNHDKTHLIVHGVDGATNKHAIFIVNLSTQDVKQITPDDFVTGGTITLGSLIVSQASNLVLFRADRFVDEKHEIFAVGF